MLDKLYTSNSFKKNIIQIFRNPRSRFTRIRHNSIIDVRDSWDGLYHLKSWCFRDIEQISRRIDKNYTHLYIQQPVKCSNHWKSRNFNFTVFRTPQNLTSRHGECRIHDISDAFEIHVYFNCTFSNEHTDVWRSTEIGHALPWAVVITTLVCH